MPTTSFYAGAGDGYVDAAITTIYNTWSDCRAAAGARHGDTDTKENMYNAVASGYYYNRRMFFPIDTSALGSSASISSATFKAYYEGQTWSPGSNPCNFALVATTQTSTSELENGDYARVGTTRLCDTDILTTASAGYQSWSLNSSGLSAISKTSFTKIGLRGSNDFSDDTAPAGYSGGNIRFSEYTSTTSDPYIEITYSTTNIKSINGLAKASVKSKNGLAIANIKNINGLS